MGDDLTAVYVRLSTEQAERLDRAAANLPARKKDVIAGLVDQFVDPDSDDGLEALRTIASVGKGELVSGIDTPARRPADVDTQAPILTPAGAAALLAVREADVLELAEHGELPGRRVAGHWRFSRAALIDWVARPAQGRVA
jgi:excisionase family DNA binding protein